MPQELFLHSVGTAGKHREAVSAKAGGNSHIEECDQKMEKAPKVDVELEEEIQKLQAGDEGRNICVVASLFTIGASQAWQ